MPGRLPPRRYVNLACILLFRDISVPVKKRFPTLLHVVSAGMMTRAELSIIEESQPQSHRTYWIPIVWAMNLVHRARVDKRIADDLYAESLLTVHYGSEMPYAETSYHPLSHELGRE